MKSNGGPQVLIIFFIINSILVDLSDSTSIQLPGRMLERESDSNDQYNKIGWTTYTLDSSSMAEIKVLEDGDFHFAWKLDRSTPNKLYFNNRLIESTVIFNESDYIDVKAGDRLKWVFSVADINGGKCWIAFPNEYLPISGIQPTQHGCSFNLANATHEDIINGPISGITGTTLIFSVKFGSLDSYIIDWGDGQNTTMAYNEPGVSVQVSHSWNENKKYEIKMIARNDVNHSARHIIKIFDQVPLSNDTIQEAINNIENYTELILERPEYTCKDLSINNKNNIIIRPARGYSKLAGDYSNVKLFINYSNYVEISGLEIKKSHNGIRIIHSDNLNISFNKIEFGCGNIGLLIESGRYNVIMGNEIWNLSNPQEIKSSWGIAIDEGTDNMLINNKINHNSMNHLYYYVLSYENQNNTIIANDLNRNIIDPDRDFFVKLGDCDYSWNAEGFRQSIRVGCTILPLDNNDDPNIWSC